MKTENIDWSKGDGLVPAIIQDSTTERVLMLGYLNQESLASSLKSGKVTFFSRSRQKLWVKGESSGNYLTLVSIAVDCDGDTLLIRAQPEGPTCHLGTTSCFDNDDLEVREPRSDLGFLSELTAVINERFANPSLPESYVAKLIKSGTDRMAQKVGEEAIETVIASKNPDLSQFEGEAADLLFHLMVLLKAKGSSLASVATVLKGRHTKASAVGR